MVAVDTSIMAFAINRFAPQHPRAARVIDELVNGDVPWGLPVTVAHEFLRLTTHPHAVVRPLEPTEALTFVQSLLASPTARLLLPTDRHLSVMAEILAASNAAGGIPAGVETAVLLREHGVREILSCDRGMSRFPFLTVIDPIRGDSWTPERKAARRYRVLRPRIMP